jgi:hypothetical protein
VGLTSSLLVNRGPFHLAATKPVLRPRYFYPPTMGGWLDGVCSAEKPVIRRLINC